MGVPTNRLLTDSSLSRRVTPARFDLRRNVLADVSQLSRAQRTCIFAQRDRSDDCIFDGAVFLNVVTDAEIERTSGESDQRVGFERKWRSNRVICTATLNR